MRRAPLIVAVAAALAVGACAVPGARGPGDDEGTPRLVAHGSAVQLVVDGKPFLVLGGELGNSTASDPASLRPFWPLFDSLHLNTVLAPVSWELIEPIEGRFDFGPVDSLLAQAREHGKRLVLLWFGSWKNSMSSYVPAWVKRDEIRFPRAALPGGQGMEMLSAFSERNREADARAFAALLMHLRRVDGLRHTVLMVQVENEVGMIPNARDHSVLADGVFAAPVPAALLRYLASHRDSLAPMLRQRWGSRGAPMVGTWDEVFGVGAETDELFMAWHFATYVEAVAAAGKRAYPLPMFVNAALIRPGRRPGEYPSAGPLPHLRDVWRAAAPSVDFLAPDIYFPNFVEWARAYARRGEPFFVPETGRTPTAAPANALFAVGALDAIGVSPFAIERHRGDDRLAEAYAVLEQLAPLILEHQGDGSLAGLCPPASFEGVVDTSAQVVRLGDYTLRVAFTDPFGRPSGESVAGHGGLVIRLGPDEYLLAGRGITVTFATQGAIAGIESIREGRYVGARWVPGRLLNGDESHQGRHLRIPEDHFGIQRVRLYRYH